MARSIAQLVDDVIGREGNYSNHPSDTGGPTRWGVTQAVARQNGYAGDMRDFPRERAVEIYVRSYWIKPSFDQVAAIYPSVAAELFDTGINMGIGTAAKFLQRALNGLNMRGTAYPDVAVDGSIGSATLKALAAYKAKRGTDGEAVLVKALDALQGERYFELAEGRPANEDFLYGWLRTRLGNAA